MLLLSIVLIGTTMALMTLLELRQPGFSWRSRILNLQAFALSWSLVWLYLPLLNLAKFPSIIEAAQLPFLAGALIYIFVMDLLEYLFHRVQHAVPLLWAMHSLHHSDPDMNATTVERHFWGDRVIKLLTIWPLAFLIVQPTLGIVLAYMVVCMWHTVVHSSVGFSFGKWSWLLNSPGYHRRHHSSDPRHFNSNFAALFPIFDVLTGTYRKPEPDATTGLDVMPQRFSDLVIWPVRPGVQRTANSESQGFA